ncbi:MAG: hypothetical protein ABJ327_12025 [Litoreibacter sp.]
MEKTIVIVLIAILIAAFSSAVAKWKNRNPNNWIIISILLGPAGLLVVLFPKKQSSGSVKSYHGNWVIGIISIVSLGVLFTQTNVVTELNKGTFNCDNIKSDVIALSENQTDNQKLLGLFEEKTILKQDTRVECEAIAVLADSTKSKVKYQAYIEYDQWWIKYELE